MTDPNILDRLRDLVARAAEVTDGDVETVRTMTDDAFLPEYLDSIGLATLIGMVEDSWSILFEDEELGPELFESLVALGDGVTRKLKMQT